MISLLIASGLFALATYGFTKRANKLLPDDLSSAYKQMETALITGFLAYISLAGSLVLIYVTK